MRFVFKIWFFFEMCFHFWNVKKGLVSVVFSFSKKHNCKQTRLKRIESKIAQKYAPKAMYKSILKMFKALNCLNSSNSLNLNCYNSYDSQTCLNLFRFNMIWIVTIHVILKHVWTCWNMSELVQIIWYELLRFMWFSNMS